MAYDPVTHQIVLFGGFQDIGGGAGNLENDTWTWDGNTWTQQHPATSPPPTTNGAMAFDPSLGRLVLFGGEGNSSGTWGWSGGNWNPISVPASPPARFDHAMAYDAAGMALILTGGALSAGGATLADTWSFDQGWHQLSPSTPPPAVANAGLATDPRSGHLVLFGGATPPRVQRADLRMGATDPRR